MRRNTVRALLLGFGFCAWMIWHSAGTPQAAESSVPEIIEEAAYGVVRIAAVNGELDDENRSYATGSGFAVGKAGEPSDIFVTNRHVVMNDDGSMHDHIYILLDNEAVTADAGKLNVFHRDHMVECEVLYTTDDYPDVAVLRAERVVSERRALPFKRAEDTQRVGTVYALGFPGTADNSEGGKYLPATVERMSISGGTLSRFSVLDSRHGTRIIEHHAHINSGNSGGPLVDADGAVIGINSYSRNTENRGGEYSLSIYSDYAMEALDRLGLEYSMYEEPEPLSRKLIPLGCGAAAAVLIAAAGFLVIRRRKKPKEPELLLRIRGVSGAYAGQRFAVKQQLTMGRDPQKNDLVFPKDAKGVSGAHCQLFYMDGELYIQDMNSTYGTFVNENRIEGEAPVLLHEGDQFYLGNPQERFSIVRSGSQSG